MTPQDHAWLYKRMQSYAEQSVCKFVTLFVKFKVIELLTQLKRLEMIIFCFLLVKLSN